MNEKRKTEIIIKAKKVLIRKQMCLGTFMFEVVTPYIAQTKAMIQLYVEKLEKEGFEADTYILEAVENQIKNLNTYYDNMRNYESFKNEDFDWKAEKTSVK